MPAAKNKDSSQVATQYAEAVVAKQIPACSWIIKACQRHLRDLQTPDFPHFYSDAHANRACDFIQALPLTKGKWATKNERFLLQPFQKFIVCSIFGWLQKEDGLRRFREAFILIPRKNGKSELAAAIAMYMLCCDGDHGFEGYVGANSEKQAWAVFRPAHQMASRTPDLRKYLGVSVHAKSVVVESTGSRLEPTIGKPGDGASVSLGVCDEYHESDSPAIYDTFKTGMGSREQPLLLVISTAGNNTASPCHELQVQAEQVLDQTLVDERLFTMIFTVDATTDWTKPEALWMANPNLGISINLDTLLHDQEMAVKNASKANVFKTRHLDIWSNADVAFFNVQAWINSKDITLVEEQFKLDPCYIGIDLASQVDLSAVVKVYVRSVDSKLHYFIFPRAYLPEDRINQVENQMYQKWVAEGFLIPTEGAQLDYSLVREDLVADVNSKNVQAVCFDERYCSQIMQELSQLTAVTLVQVPQRVEHLSLPMKSLDAAILDGRVHHPNNEVLNWCLSNVVAHEDRNGNVFPNKLKSEYKIDSAVALINAMRQATTCDSLIGQNSTGFFFS